MSMLQQATDGRMLHRMRRGLRPEPMNCKECWEKAGKPVSPYYKVYLRRTHCVSRFTGVCEWHCGTIVHQINNEL